MVHIGLTPHTQKEPTQPTQGASLTQKHKKGQIGDTLRAAGRVARPSMLTSRDDGRDREPRGSRGVGCPCHACRQTRRRVPPRGRAGRPHPPPVGALGEPSGRRTFVVLFVVLVDFAGAGRRFLVPSHEPLRKPLVAAGSLPWPRIGSDELRIGWAENHVVLRRAELREQPKNHMKVGTARAQLHCVRTFRLGYRIPGPCPNQVGIVPPAVDLLVSERRLDI